MSDIKNIDIRLMDATLMQVFLGLMRHGKATLVAEEMGLTQPAVSHALKRLRGLYGDPLFLRKPHGLEPTRTALDLEPKIRQILRLMSETLAPPALFDPSSGDMTVRLAGYDYELAMILPQLANFIAEQGATIRLHALPLETKAALAGLRDGTVDLAVGFFDPLQLNAAGGGFIDDALYQEDYLVAARAGHPFLQAPDLSAYTAAKHLQISQAGLVKGRVDHALENLGLSRDVAVTVPVFFPALVLLGETDLIGTLPRRLAEVHGPRFGLGTTELPLGVRKFTISAVRHRRDQRNPLLDWLVDRMRVISPPSYPDPSS